MAGIYRSMKRKLCLNIRNITIYTIALIVTFSLAYYHRTLQNEEGINSLFIRNTNETISQHSLEVVNKEIPPNIFNNMIRPIDNDIKTEGRSIMKEKESNGNGKECSVPVKESVADYNTFEMFKQIQTGTTVTGKTSNNKEKKEKLKVFILPFSHVDPGWLKTFEQYTEDTNQILTNMHSFMVKNNKMTFMWAEMIFFEKWWKLQNETTKTEVKKLVTDGRLELASGSFVMTDEANPYFPVSVDNIVEGMQFVHQNFHIKPSVIWSNDPFGYSNSVPYLFRKTGIRWNVINRIHHGIKQTLQSFNAIPFNWRQYFDSTGSDDILTHVLPYTHYDILNSCGPNPGACCEFDFKRMTHWSCPGPAPQPITPQNVKEKANTLLNQLETMKKMYKAPVLLMMHGDDFRYNMIEEWHQHHDNFIPLFEEINKGDRAEIRFGTFSDYFNEMEKYIKLNEDAKPPTLSGDFFPYKCAIGDYWTGYFTTRPFYKRQGRILHNMIRNADIALALRRNTLKKEKIDEILPKMETSRRNLALFQHHDAITGTSKVSVMDNYSELLYNSIMAMKSVLEELVSSSMNTNAKDHESTEVAILQSISNGKDIEVNVFNSLLYTIEELIEVRVDTDMITVYSDNQPIDAQIEPFFDQGVIDKQSYLVVFKSKIPALSTVKFVIKKDESGKNTKRVKLLTNNKTQWESKLDSKFDIDSPGDVSLENDHIKTEHDKTTGAIQKFTTKHNNMVFDCKQSWKFYRAANGGAYLMRIHSNPTDIDDFNWIIFKGPIRQSMYRKTQHIFERTSIKNIDGNRGKEVDIDVRIDITKERNTELMVQYVTNDAVDTYTDSVGMQLLRRETHKGTPESNYYPMPTSVVLQNDKKRLSIVSNLEHGARFIENGGVEINIDRILNQDDGKGLGGDSNSLPIDLKPFDMKLKLIGEEMNGGQKNDDKQHYTTQSLHAQHGLQSIIYPPMVFVSSKLNSELIASKLQFPCDIQLLTIRSLPDNKQFIQLFRHATPICSTDNCGGDLKIALVDLFKSMGIKRVQRTDLSGITPLGDMSNIDDFNQFNIKTFDFLNIVLYG